jgi:hypothetical protein
MLLPPAALELPLAVLLIIGCQTMSNTKAFRPSLTPWRQHALEMTQAQSQWKAFKGEN